MSTHPADALFGTLRADRDYHIAAINNTLAEWLDYSPSELIGRRFDSLLDGAGRLFFEAQCLPNLEINHLIEEVYLNLQTKKGTPVPVLINASRHTDDDNHCIDIAFVRIARRARLEDELLRTKKLAVQADEAKSRFLGMITHELRNPLQSISLATDLLLDGSTGQINSVQKELLEGSREAGDNLANLINDILDFAGMHSGNVKVQTEPVSARALLERTDVLLRPRIKTAGIDYVAEPVPENLTVEGDPKRIQQVLLNLITNAMKFTPAGGRISTRVVTSGDQASFEVEDTGCGISKGDLQQIFEAFVQVGSKQQRAEGIGLGLAISRDLAHAMRGKLQVQSTPDVGSTFSLSLPLAAAAVQNPA